MIYQVWDQITANLIGEFETREEAEEVVAQDETLFIVEVNEEDLVAVLYRGVREWVNPGVPFN